MVELVVVLLLISILTSITVFSALAWTDWSKFQQENATAEDIYFVAQNQLTEFDSSGAMYRRVQSVIMDSEGNYDSAYILAQGYDSVNPDSYPDFAAILSNSGDETYSWSTIWNEPATNSKKNKKTIITLTAKRGDYEKYQNNRNSVSEGTRLLFELIESGVADKSVLNKCISIEFSPEAGQVFAVCFSDRADEFYYGTVPSEASENNKVYTDISKREVADRKDVMLGYYGVDTLSSKLKGRGFVSSKYKLEIENGNMLSLILTPEDASSKLKDGDKVHFDIKGSADYENGVGDSDVKMSFDVAIGTDDGELDPGLVGTPSELTDPDKKAKYIQTVTVTFPSQSDSIFKGSNKSFNIPMWIDSSGRLYVVLDAVDIQAQSLTYADMCGYINDLTGGEKESCIEAAKESFAKTFSFYRFGFVDTKYITASASVNGQGAVDARRKGLDVVYGDEGAPKSERTTFANYGSDYTTIATNKSVDDDNIYGITNARHLYNIRFETDYKQNTERRVFLVRENIDWKNLIDGSYEDLDHVNLFLNSMVDVRGTGRIESGIKFDGKTVEFLDYYVSNQLKTELCPFPGFRMLGYGDSFEQVAEFNVNNPSGEGTQYRISNINISFAANCSYGIYGRTTQDEFLGFSETKDGHYDGKTWNYNTINDKSTQGFYPIGLFAESYGDIKNIELDNITVKAVEKFDNKGTDSFVFTSKVGALVGDNFGNVSNIFIDVNNPERVAPGAELADESYALFDKKYNSFINGRSDVGGIVGHQYFKLRTRSTAVTVDNKKASISGCINYAKVTGIGYVGGIIGRIYPGEVYNGTNSYQVYKPTDSNYNIFEGYKFYNVNRISDCANDKEVGGYDTTTGDKEIALVNLRSFTIENCKNYGEITMEENFARQVVGGNTLRRGFFFGGITGAAIGYYQINQKDMKWYKNFEDETKNVVIKNCESYTLYTDSEINSILYDQNSENYFMNSRMKAIFVGGIAGGARFAYIDNCSTTPSGSSTVRPFVFGDKYVGGVTGYNVNTNFIGGSTYTTTELGKITTLTTGYRSDYSIINGTNVVGNYAVGGIAGAFGRPDSGKTSYEFYGEIVENAYKYTNLAAQQCIPFGCGQLQKTKFNAKGMLNTAVVLGNSFNYSISHTGNSECGRLYQCVGGITGFAGSEISDTDFIQTEATKKYYLKLVDQNKVIYDESKTVSEMLDDENITTKLQSLIDSSNFVTDSVGGIAGLSGFYGHFNASDIGTTVRVDAIVFGRNRVGGFMGENESYTDRAGHVTLANLVPCKVNANSSGMYVLGRDCVGGFVGAWCEGKDAYIAGDRTKSGSLNKSDYYNNIPLTNGYSVIGYRAVGGVLGINSFTEKNDYVINHKTTLPDGEFVNVKGSIYVGGVVGIDENKRDAIHYNVSINNVNVSADMIAGGIAGAVYPNTSYYQIDKLVSAESTLENVNVTSKAFSGGVAGLYAFNTVTGSNTVSGLLDNNSRYENQDKYSSYNAQPKNGLSVNGLVKSDLINQLNYNSSGVLSTNVNSVKTTFTEAYRKNVPLLTFDMTAVSGTIDSSNSVNAGVYSGGFLGYIPEGVYVEVDNYTNAAKVTASDVLQGSETGPSTNYTYSYLGGVIGRVTPKMTLKDCFNLSTGDNYTSPATALGGLTEVNLGTITGTYTGSGFDKVYTCSNTTTYNYNNKNVGAFAGINLGTISEVENTAIIHGKWAGGIVYENDGTISNSANKGDVFGNYVGGIAAYSGASSSIINCINYGVIGTATGDAVSSGAAGIIYQSVAANTIKDSVNVGLVLTGSTDNSGAAGIVYDTSGYGNLVCNRNYGTGLVNGITATNAATIKYNLDTSNATNHFGDVAAEEPTDNMFANFYISRKVQGTSLDDPGTNITESKQGYFMAFKSYGNTVYENNYWVEDINFDYNNKTDISEMVLGVSPDVYNADDYHQTDSVWPLVDPNNSNNTLSFVLKPISDDGTAIAYSKMKDFAIVWDNYNATDYNTFYKYAEWDTYQSYRDDFETIKLSYPENKSISYLDIAKDERTYGTNSVQYYGSQTTLNSLSSWWMQDDNNLSLYASAMYCLAKEQATDENKTVTLESYLSLLYTYAKNGNPINFYNPNDSYNTYITNYTGDSYSSFRSEFDAKTYDYTEMISTTFKTIADEEFDTNTDHATTYGLDDDFLNDKNDNSSNHLKYAQSVYGYFIDNHEPLNVTVTTEGEKVINGTKDSIDALIEEYRAQLYSTYAIQYVREEYYTFPRLQLAYDIIFTSVDVNGVKSTLRIPQIQVTNTDSAYSISTFNYATYNGNKRVDSGFDPDRIVEVKFAIKKDYNNTSYPVGIRAFLWTYDGEQSQTTMHGLPPEYAATVDADDELFAGTTDAAQVLAKVKANKIKSQKLVVNDESADEFDLYLWKYPTGINGLDYNPLLSGEGKYLSDTSPMSFANPTTCIRMQMFRDIDQSYLNFIGDH